MTRRALILGIGGQDGSYLAELLLQQGYEVHGLYRRSSANNMSRIQHLIDEELIHLHRGDITDTESFLRILDDCLPHEVYNLADQDHVDWSNIIVGYSLDTTMGAVGRMLEAIKTYYPKTRFFQAISALIFGKQPSPHFLHTTLDPQSVYACAKAGALHLCRYYRETRKLHVVTGILYNHDSPRRQGDYLLHKICRGLLRIQEGKQDSLLLGDTSVRLEIGHARDYVKGMVLALRADTPDDHILCTGRPYSILQWIEEASRIIGLSKIPDIRRSYAFDRPGTSSEFYGDPERAWQKFNWRHETTRTQLLEEIIEAERERL